VSNEEVADDFTGFEVFLPDTMPEGSIPVHAVVVIEYINKDGETEHAYETLGDARAIHAIGLLEAGKLMLWDDIHDEEDEEI